MAQPRTLAVFTKNRLNPAYAAARLAADRVAAEAGGRTVHYVPETPDDVGQQKVLVGEALADRPDAVVFVPTDDRAMVEDVRRFEAAGIPVVNCVNRMEGRFVSFVGSDDVAVGYSAARALIEGLGGKGDIVVIEGSAGAPTARDRAVGLAPGPGRGAGGPCAGLRRRRLPGGSRRGWRWRGCWPSIRASTACGPATTSWPSARSRRWPRPDAAPRWWASTACPAPSSASSRARCWPASISAPSISPPSPPAPPCAISPARPCPTQIMIPAVLIDRTNHRAWQVPFAARPLMAWEDVVGGCSVARQMKRLALLIGLALALGATDVVAQSRAAPPAATLIDINSASRDDLMNLDGIGEVRADAIIRARPFKAKTELVERRLIPEALYDKIADKVMARPVPGTTPTPTTRPPAGQKRS